MVLLASQVEASGKESTCQSGDTRDVDSIPGSGRSPGGGDGHLLQYSCLENPVDRGAWWATVHGVTKELDTNKQLYTHTHTHTNTTNRFQEVSGLYTVWSSFSLLLLLSRFSCVQLFATPWTVAHQVLLSMGFSRQEYWSGLSCPPPWDLPDPGMELMSLMSPALAGRFFTTRATWEAQDDQV